MNIQAIYRCIQAHSRLILLAVCSETLYLVYFLRQFPLLRLVNDPYQDMGQITNHSHAAFAAFVAVMGWLFVLWGLALWWAHPFPSRQTLRIVLIAGAVMGATMALVYPITALDSFAYISQSLIAVQYHQNPIMVPPATYPHDPLMGLAGGWGALGAPYGPLGIAIDALPTLVAGRNVAFNLVLLKLGFSALTLVAAYLVHEILVRIRSPYAVVGAIFVAWNPLVLLEISANGHNDVAMVTLVLVGLLYLAEGGLSRGPVWILLSAFVKYATLVLLPLVLAYGFRRQNGRRARIRYLATMMGLFAVITVVAYEPFWAGPETLRRTLMEGQFYLYSFSSVVYDIVPGVGHERATVAGRLLYVALYPFLCWLAVRDFESLLRACFLGLFGFLALGVSNVKYWYIVAPGALAACLSSLPERLSAVVMCMGMELAVALNIYVWVWVGVTEDNFKPINMVSYLAVFVAPALLLGMGRLFPGQGRRGYGEVDDCGSAVSPSKTAG